MTYQVGDQYYNEQYQLVDKPTSGTITGVNFNVNGSPASLDYLADPTKAGYMGLNADTLSQLATASGVTLGSGSSDYFNNLRVNSSDLAGQLNQGTPLTDALTRYGITPEQYATMQPGVDQQRTTQLAESGQNVLAPQNASYVTPEQTAAAKTDQQQVQQAQQPQAPVAGTAMPPPDIHSVLQGVYSSRPDLQAIYRPDGSRINSNDGNPATLMDWAKTFGINESPLIKQALSTPSQPTVPAGTSTSQAGVPSGTAGLTSGGAGGVVAPPGIDPKKFVDDTYKQTYADLGLASVKQHYDDTNKQLLDLKNKITDEKAAVNANPWLTEGTRVAQLGKIDDKYEQKQANLLSYLTLTNNMYQQGLEQAQFLTSQAVGLESDQIAFDHQVALKQMDYAKADADARYQIAEGNPFYKYPGSDTVYSTATGKPISYEQYIAQGGNGKFSDTFEIPTADQTAVKTQVLGLMKNYGDAGILPTDTLEAAMTKVKSNSLLYRKDTYIAPSSSDSGLGDMLKLLQIQNAQADLTNKQGGTDAQRTAAGYADRIQQSNTILSQLEKSIQGYNPGGYYLQKNLPSYLQSSNVQQYNQAIQNFVNAVLRRESGAAISQSEYDNATKQYFALPGDSDATVAQKIQNRSTQYTNLVRDAGMAATAATSTSDPLGLFK